jgi:hypothetical protein
MIEIPRLPTTKQFRDAVKTAFQTHGLKMSKSSTRAELLSDWDINHNVRMHYNYRDRNLSRQVRRVDIWIPRNEDESYQDNLHLALTDIRVWMKLSGVEPFMKLRQPSFEDNRITAWCLIS